MVVSVEQKQNVPWVDLRPLGIEPELRDGEYRRGPRVRDPDEPESHVGAARYAPPVVQWTFVEPVVPGLYAIRVDGGKRRLVDVYADKRGRMVASSCCVPEFPVARCGFEFSNQPYMEPE